MSDELNTAEKVDIARSVLVDLSGPLELIKRGIDGVDWGTDKEGTQHLVALCLATAHRLLDEGSPLDTKRYKGMSHEVMDILQRFHEINNHQSEEMH